jgi:hypothetical protein
MNISSRFFTSYPLGITGCRCGFAIKGQGTLQNYEWHSSGNMLDKSLIQESTLLLQNSAYHGNACVTQHGQSAPGYHGIRVHHACIHPNNSRIDQGLGTRGSPAVMGTGFQGHIDIGTPGIVSSLAESMNFSMGRSRFPVPAFTYYLPIADNHTANGRIWRCPANPPACKDKCPFHHFVLEISHVRCLPAKERGYPLATLRRS